MMATLKTPSRAIRMKPSGKRDNHSPWHLQSNGKKNYTVCGQIIADGWGWKRRPDSEYLRTYYRPFHFQPWEVKPISEIKSTKDFCQSCLGAMTVEKTVNQPELFYR